MSRHQLIFGPVWQQGRPLVAILVQKLRTWFPMIISDSAGWISTKFCTDVPWVDIPIPVDFRSGLTTGVPPGGNLVQKLRTWFPMIISESSCWILMKFHANISWVDVLTLVGFRTASTAGLPPGSNFSELGFWWLSGKVIVRFQQNLT